MWTAISLCLTLAVSDFVDSFARPRRRPFCGGWRALLFRFAALAWIWLVALAISRRPAFAFVATIVTGVILVVISNLKALSLAEPLVFADFAFLGPILRYPRLFYLERRAVLLIVAAIAVTLGLIVLWWHVEPVALGGAMWLIPLAGALALPIVVLLRPGGGWLDRLAAGVAPVPRLDGHLGSLGLVGSLAAYWTRWVDEGRRPQRGPSIPAPVMERGDYDAVLVIQAESFVDLRRLGMAGLDLPAYDSLKERARATGLIEVPCVGAYTLRPEAAAITGLGFDDLGFGGFHPYLRSRRLAPFALPRALHGERWERIFVHPYDPAFFRREIAIPRFRFDRFADISCFSEADREGHYVGDLAVADFLIGAFRKARGEGKCLYAQAVTMEAHDPFGPGRLPGEDDPVRQFVHHLRNADRMLARLAEALDAEARRVLLVHYGDHVPVLPGFADPFPDTRTDFLVVELGREAEATPVLGTISRPEHLNALVRAALVLEAP
ncbi:Phosphoglycerol transferase MdoB [Faunimonas pinastri]|uniref:Phosphoglycerol transferase MdoB n=1 Tax=Faunimonas pinastri TaxID=1855383 RepID=A0A1H9FF56_9HYPH|nr:sulfatase-like hydrolase/transferase [Faunimonas pinastri]SEQ36581.1 Phosphoglycerol transferase MdoB [Faunimonas pinastri]